MQSSLDVVREPQEIEVYQTFTLVGVVLSWEPVTDEERKIDIISPNPLGGLKLRVPF